MSSSLQRASDERVAELKENLQSIRARIAEAVGPTSRLALVTSSSQST